MLKLLLSVSMGNGERVLGEEVVPSISIVDSFVESGANVWIFCDDLVCGFLSLLDGRSCPFSFFFCSQRYS